MSDPLSVSASVLTVIGSGFAIAKGLYELADGIGTAGVQVRIYADEIRLFSELLGHTRDELRNNSQRPRPRAEHLIMDILHVFESVLEPPKQLQATLNPLLLRFRSSPTRLLQVALRVRWLFSAKDKLLWYRESLKVLNGILNTTLTAMKTTMEINNTSNWYIQCDSLQMCILAVRRSLTDPRQLQLGGFLQPTIQSLSLLDGTATALEGVLTPPPSTRLHLTYPAQRASQNSNTDSELDPRENVNGVANATNGALQPQALIPISTQEVEPGDTNDHQDAETSEIVEIQRSVTATVDAQFDTSAHEIWEDLRTVSRKALRYAEDVLRDCSQAESQEQPPAQGSQPDAFPKDPDQDSQYVHLKTVHGEIRIPSSQAENFQFNASKENMIARSLLVRDGHGLLSKRSPFHKLLTLRNVDGKSYQVPYYLVRDWEDAKAILLSFKYPRLLDLNKGNSEVAPSELFNNGDFDLIGPEGQHIMPRFWRQTVQPFWIVQLQFKDSVYWSDKTIKQPLCQISSTSNPLASSMTALVTTPWAVLAMLWAMIGAFGQKQKGMTE